MLWKTGGNWAQTFERFKPRNRLNKPKLFATGCHRLPRTSHGKQGVCRGLPAVAGGPLPAKEGFDLVVVCCGYFLLLHAGHGHWTQPQPVHAFRITARS
jgi:hypothetical protein